ncbi:Glucose/arabinose dehydrogenase, beta-propeller fold [Actinacidiphila yanglinensis]|uniref:Glucose/arabinose dehydrogenase, beta-propeller fold n=1 Tax=Actinacidiphila yanglinensis TaxID=310779 RepID=A0A1H6E685_9ACTN|nr:PQQ-dependent sugar dehydrogenase [Actinacidiphila yanglinensis]SEG93157.1 Glucose/arabinose dehydrogenase, beta-propeller fold [Actinacidiphila yanglinensis]
MTARRRTLAEEIGPGFRVQAARWEERPRAARHRGRGAAAGALAVAAVLVAGCSSGSGGATSSASASTSGSPSASTPAVTGSASAAPTTGSASTAPASPTATPGAPSGSATVTGTLAKNLDVPWGMAELPGGDLLVDSRDTAVVQRIAAGTGRRTVAGTVPGVVSTRSSEGETGLLGLALSPHFSTDRLIYLYFSTATDNRIAKLTYTPSAAPGHQLGTLHVILKGIPRNIHHDGGRIAFGPDGMLYAGTGDAENLALPQNKSSLGGKILRMTPDGKPAPGNPFGDSVVYTIGHRNVQGLAWDPQGNLWAAELGDRKADELNLIRAGRNYGWPATQGRTDHPGYTSPVAQFGTELDSPSGIAWADGCIWMAALKGERLWRIPLDGTRLVAAPQGRLVATYGRLRTVLAYGGGLLVTTSNTDGRISPKPGDDKILKVKVS